MKITLTLKALTVLLVWLPISAQALNLAQDPLFLAATEPRVMLVASRDHQLSMKAYTDYSDLDGDGVLDTTYKDTINYYGYFDSNKCYSYSTSGSRFNPSSTTSNGHKCDGTTWSGNFLNWVSMTRMDVLRKTFYGGNRVVDTDGTGYEAVLERHFLPYDVHAFAKVYNPGSNAALQNYMPSDVAGAAATAISFCNVSWSSSSTLTGSMTSLPAPLIRVALGAYPQWDASEVKQCATSASGGTRPATATDFNARVKVCDSSVGLESNCKAYIQPVTGVQTVKPVGLLQRYGDIDETKRVRFGLMTGSYDKNKSGGVLRKNVTLLANNSKTDISSASVCGNNNANDEINACTGKFINQGADKAGIINTLSRLRIAGYQFSTSKHQKSCSGSGLASFTNGQCIDWGNPLSEIYLESLRYFAGQGVSSGFDASDSGFLDSIPKVAWSDPLPVAEWCALSSIVVLSTGLNSFDTDELTAFTLTGGSTVDSATLTNTVGTAEDITGDSYMVGSNGVTTDNRCTAKTVSALSSVKGICPEVPSLEGGYGIAGLAYAPKTIDFRPSYSSQRSSRWSDVNQDWALRQPISSYMVQLAESLPSFSVPVSGGAITILPNCEANSGTATRITSGWRNCSMTNLIVNDNVAKADVGAAIDKTCSGNGTTSGCFTVAWEDSTWGSDYDMDGIQRLGYCAGSACDDFRMLCPSTTNFKDYVGEGVSWTGSTGNNQLRVVNCAIQADAGDALLFGYTVTGSTDDGYDRSKAVLRPGGYNSNCTATTYSGQPNAFVVGCRLPTTVDAAKSTVFTRGASAGKLLNNPLWYAAKYGGFTESDPSTGTPIPNQTSEWDAVNNDTNAETPDGRPDNYFDVKNPANLYTSLGSVFDKASKTDSAASSVATTSSSLTDNSYIFQAKFSPTDWSGEVLAYRVNEAGVLTTPAAWQAKSKLDDLAPADRVIITKGTSDGVAFAWANLTTGQQTALNKNFYAVADACGELRLGYLRGDPANEGDVGNIASGACTAAKLRPRSSKLGDIVDSNPWFVGPPSAGYSSSAYPGYGDFRTRYKSRKPVVYVGANDGMLHGFDASIKTDGSPTTTAGSEVLAYVPSPVYGNLSRLTARNYNKNHRYFVDGSPFVGDAFLNLTALGSSNTDKWRSVLVGGLGAGGKGYFALDVTNPDSTGTGINAPTFAAANAASLLLWEFTDSDDSDMGNSFNLPPQTEITSQAKQIARMENNKWAVVLGNGYNSTNGKAVLYILFIEGGVDGTWTVTTDYIKLVADSGSGNGLSTPVPFDSDGNGKADVIYAGDLKGNLWKFDVSGSDTAQWVVGTREPNPNPTNVVSEGIALFLARDTASPALPQPIVSPPVPMLHPTEGVLVLFGTGKFLESTDTSSTQTQSFYGVWDNGWTNPSTGPAVIPLTRSSLLEQTITESDSKRTLTQTAYTDSNADSIPDEKGWRVDLPTAKERVTGIPRVARGILFFNTIIPDTSPCESGGSGWLMAASASSGSLLNLAVFDYDGDGDIDSDDTPTAGAEVGMSPGGSLIVRGPGDGPGVVVTNNTNGALEGVTNPETAGTHDLTKVNLGPSKGGRVTWREILR